MLSYTQAKNAPRCKNCLWRSNMIIKRKQYLNELIKKKNNGRIKIITGIRRCGKSYLLFKLYKDYLLGTE